MSNIHNNQIQQAGSGNSLTIQANGITELAACSVAQLKREQQIRRGLLEQEQNKQLMQWLALLLWLLMGGGGTWFAAHWWPWPNQIIIALGLFGVAAPATALYVKSQSGNSEFELRQRATLREIDYLIREKSFAAQY